MTRHRHKTPGRRLDAVASLRAGARALPRMYGGAWAALSFAVVAGVLPVIAPVPAGGTWVVAAVQGLALLMAWGALTRIGLASSLDEARRLGLGPAGLQFNAGEGRILAALLLILVFLAILLTVLGLTLLGVAGASDLDADAIRARDWAQAGQPVQLALVAVVALLVVAVPLLFAVRLSLFAQASLGRRQVVSLNTLGIAEGSFWPLLFLLAVASLPKLVLAALGAAGLLGGAVAQIAWTLVLILIQAPFAAGALGDAYRQLEYWTPRAATDNELISGDPSRPL